MIYRTTRGPIDLVANMLIAKTTEWIDHAGLFLWEAGQPIAQFTKSILIPLAYYSYLVIKTVFFTLADLSITAIVWLAEQLNEFIIWASTPQVNPQATSSPDIEFDRQILSENNDKIIREDLPFEADKFFKLLREFKKNKNEIVKNNSALYKNSLKNWEFGKKAPQNFNSERANIVETQDVQENQNSEEKPTPPKTDSLGYFNTTSEELVENIDVHLFSASQATDEVGETSDLKPPPLCKIIWDCLGK